MNGDTWIFLALCGALLAFLLAASFLSKSYSLDRIKSKTVGDGQHARRGGRRPRKSARPITPSPFVPAAGARGRNCPRSRGSSSAAWAAASVKARQEFC